MGKRSDEEISKDKISKMMDTVSFRAGYYRFNPHRFAEDFLNIRLKLFQKILLFEMMQSDAFYFVAVRGIGKTWLVSLFGCTRAILYPGTKLVAVSATFKQGKEIILKITDDFMQRSPLLRNEIKRVAVGQNECAVYFKNGSFIRVVTANENSRGIRSNILIIDESRMIQQKIVDTVLIPMNASPRQPDYLSNPQYAELQEMNKQMYMSSAWYASSEMFEKVKAYSANMLDAGLNYFICDLPYQLSIKEGLLMREQIEQEMSEATFNPVSFSMEREGLFYGASADALFSFNDLDNRRVLVNGLRPLDFYRDNNLHIPEKQSGELRILSVDVALLASRKHDNDASALIIHSAIPTESHNYLDNIVMIDTKEGLATDELGLLIMRWFYQYNCDFVAIDSNGIGLGTLDYIMSDHFDPLYGEQYCALNCVNSPEMAERCKVKNAPKVIYSIKANAKFNNDTCLAFRSAVQNGYVNLLIGEQEAEAELLKMRGYSKQTEFMKDKLRLPYIQTSMLINELINLSHDVSNGLVKVKEKSGMRKDRYSSAIYGYYVIQEQSKNLKPKQDFGSNLVNKLTIRPPKHNSGL